MQEAKKYIFNKTEGSSPSANILITGEIDEFWGTGLRNLADEITQSKAQNIMLQINSPGGSVTEGQAIAAFIKGYPAKIDTSGVGLVASIATTILLAGDSVTMDKGSWFMIHNPWANALGEAEDLRHTANLLDEMKSQLINVYVDAIQKNNKLINGRRKDTANQVAIYMEEETWFTASEALEAGFIQGITNGAEFLNKETAKNIYNSCSKFKNVPVEFLNKVEKMANTTNQEAEKETAENGFFDHIKSFFNKGKMMEEVIEEEEEEKKVVIEKAAEEEMIPEWYKETYEELKTRIDELEEKVDSMTGESDTSEGKEIEAKEEVEVSNSKLENQLEAMQSKIELQAKQLQQIKEEKEGSPTATDCFAETSNTKKTNVQLLMSKKENKSFFDNIAQILK
jgi:ATP-dependent Clp protease protease subunit